MATSKNNSRSVIAASDELKDVYCEPCINDGKQVEAEGFCGDCCEYLCGQCYKNHKRYKAFRHHVLQDKDKMPVDTTKAVARDVCVEKCDIHPTKVIEYFCKPCDQLGCQVCITVNHRQCDTIDHIPNIAMDLGKSEEFKGFMNKLDKRLEDVKERKKKLSSNITKTDEMKRKAKAELKKQREEINKFFDHLEAKMEGRIDQIDTNNKKTLKATKTTCDTIDDDIIQMKTAIDTKQKNGENCELFITFKNCKQKMETVDKEFGKLGSKIQQYALTPSSQIQEMINNTTEICRLRTAKFVSEKKIDTDNDKEPITFIRGLAVVQNHYLAVLDYMTQSVHVVDTTNMKVTNEMNMNCDGFGDITAVNNDQIAVVLSPDLQSKIQFLSVSVSGSLRKGGQLAIDGIDRGLAYSRGRFFILGDSDVRIIDMQGQTLSTINTGGSFDSIAVSPNNETIYLANKSENSVTSMSLDGNVKAIYKDNDLKSPGFITLDSEGLVYVESSGRIHQLTEDLNKIQVLLEDVCAIAITYSNTDNRLYTMCDEITVYQIE